MCVWVCSLSHKLPSKVTTFQEVVVAEGGWRTQQGQTEREREATWQMTGMKAETSKFMTEERLHQGAEKQTKGLNLCETETERERKQSVWVWKFVWLWVRGHTQCVFVSLCCCVLTVSAAVSQSRCAVCLSVSLSLSLSVNLSLPLPVFFYYPSPASWFSFLSSCTSGSELLLCMIVQAAGEAGGSGGCLSGDGLLHACRERAEQLEVCLERAQVSLEGSRQQAQDAAMQHCIEQQLHNCQVITHTHIYLHFKGQGNVLIFDLSLHVSFKYILLWL